MVYIFFSIICYAQHHFTTKVLWISAVFLYLLCVCVCFYISLCSFTCWRDDYMLCTSYNIIVHTRIKSKNVYTIVKNDRDYFYFLLLFSYSLITFIFKRNNSGISVAVIDHKRFYFLNVCKMERNIHTRRRLIYGISE